MWVDGWVVGATMITETDRLRRPSQCHIFLVGFLPLQLGSRFSARASINFFAGGETVTFSRSTTVSLAGQPFLAGTTE